MRGIQGTLDEIVSEMSTWEEHSLISKYNRSDAGCWHDLPPGFFKVLDYALFVAEQTDGAYDPSVGLLSNCWGFGPAGKISAIPDAELIEKAIRHTGWQNIQLDRSAHRVLQSGGVSLDLSSIAKGFGVDQMARYLQSCGVNSYLVELGGELRGQGVKTDHQPWWVELMADLHASKEQAISRVIALHGLSVATSGDYLRYFTAQGKRYSHTIDPRTGYPVQHGLCSVTVLHPECMIADALATAMTVMGLEQGMAYANRLHVAALFVARGKDSVGEHMSAAFSAMLEA